jgi:hypothetical protein
MRGEASGRSGRWLNRGWKGKIINVRIEKGTRRDQRRRSR